MTGRLSAGIDIGGTKIAAGIVDEQGRVLTRRQTATPRTGAADVLAAAGDLVGALIADCGPVAAIGVGAPGVVDRVRGRVVSATEVLPGWAGAEVAARLTERFALPVAVDNDVRAAALGEAVAGAGRGIDRLLVASIGTGVGGALFLGGAMEHGSHGAAGEIAHLLVPGDGAIACGCGRFDHLEAHCSGPAIAAAYHRVALGGIGAPPLQDVARQANRGDRTARRVVAAAGDLLGRALAGLAAAVDIDALVLTGGVSRIGDLFMNPVRSAIAAGPLAALRDIPVLVGTLGGDAPLIGAARLVCPVAAESGPA